MGFSQLLFWVSLSASLGVGGRQRRRTQAGPSGDRRLLLGGLSPGHLFSRIRAPFPVGTGPGADLCFGCKAGVGDDGHGLQPPSLSENPLFSLYK